MKILLFALGSRGDFEPFLAIGQILIEKGHSVVCIGPAQYRSLAEDSHLPFLPQSEKFLEILENDSSKEFMGQKGGFLKKLKNLYHMYKVSNDLQAELVDEQREIIKTEKPDLILYHIKCLYPSIWGVANPGKSIMVSPVPGTMHEVRKESALLPFSFPLKYLIIPLLYKIVHRIIPAQIKKYTKHAIGDFKEGNALYPKLRKHLLFGQKTLYTVSPTIFNRPTFWPKNAVVVGFHERNRTHNWEPSEALLTFIENHPKVLFVTFGSMVNDNPEQKTKDLISVVEKHSIPTIINTSAGGLLAVENTSSLIHFTNSVPYEWILPKVHALMHHGGSGTTHSAIKNGLPNVIIPHILDQYYWNRLNFNLGCGPLGFPVKKFNKNTAEKTILDIWNNPTYLKNAQLKSIEMKKEKLENVLLNEILTSG